MLRTLLCDEDNEFRVVEDTSAIDKIVTDRNRHLWIDIEKPTIEEMAMLQEEFGLHPLAIEDALRRHQRPKIEQYDNFYVVVFYSVAIEEPGADHLAGRRGLKGTRFLGEQLGDAVLTLPTAIAPDDKDEGEDGDKGSGDEPGSGPAFPEDENGDEQIVVRELTLFLGSNFLISVHDYPIPEIEEAAQKWSRNVELISKGPRRSEHLPGTRPLTTGERDNLRLQKRSLDDQMVIPDEDTTERQGNNGTGDQINDIGILLYSLLDTIVDNYFPIMDKIVERVEVLEGQIFEKYSQAAIEGIFLLKKDLLTLRRVLAPERDILNVLIRRDLPIFERHTIVYFQDVYDHIVRITDSIDTYRDLMSSALDSFLSMQSNRLNITVQTLTSVSILLMSVATITGWYGMNFQAMPELTSRFGYPGVMLAVATVVAIELAFFKRKGWL